jgi:hypothetical protein
VPVGACPPPSPVAPGVAIYSTSEFVAIYPEFTGITDPVGSNAFNMATLLLKNCCGSVVCDPNVRLTLLYMLTAHILFLNTAGAWNQNNPPGIVGRINNAGQGSVSVSAEMPNQPMSAAYFNQTRYGAQFYASTAQFRTTYYVPAPCNYGVLGPAGGPLSPYDSFGYPPYG